MTIFHFRVNNTLLHAVSYRFYQTTLRLPSVPSVVPSLQFTSTFDATVVFISVTLIILETF